MSIAKYSGFLVIFMKDVFQCFSQMQKNYGRKSSAYNRGCCYSTTNAVVHKKEALRNRSRFHDTIVDANISRSSLAAFSNELICSVHSKIKPTFGDWMQQTGTHLLPIIQSDTWALSKAKGNKIQTCTDNEVQPRQQVPQLFNRSDKREKYPMHSKKSLFHTHGRSTTVSMFSCQQGAFLRHTAPQRINFVSCPNSSVAGARLKDVIADVKKVNNLVIHTTVEEEQRRGNCAAEKELVTTGHLCEEDVARLVAIPNDFRANSCKQTEKSKPHTKNISHPQTFGFPKLAISSKNISSIVHEMKLQNHNKSEEDAFQAFFRQPPIPEEFRLWTVAMMKGDFARTVNLQPPAMNSRTGMQNEWNRLATFADYVPPEGVFILPLAGAGFFLSEDLGGKRDADRNVECAFCSVVVAIVVFRRANPMDVHRRVSPSCSFVLGQRVGNVTIAEVAETTGGELLSNYNRTLTAACIVQSAPAMTSIANRSQGADLAVDAELPAVKGPATSRDVLAISSKPGASATPIVPPQPSSREPLPAPSFEKTNSDSCGTQQGGKAGASYQTATYTAPAPVRDPTPTCPQSSGGSAQGNTSRDTAPAVGRTEPAQGDSTSSRSSNAQGRQTVTYEDLGIISQKPKRSDMAVKQTRINTFTPWPHEATHPKDAMAEAGFYYTGHQDLVRCFHCKGGLKTWDSSDTPWVEHARWFPRCPFAKLCKGQRFIDAVQSLNDPNTRPTISLEAVATEMRRLEELERVKLSENSAQPSPIPTPPSFPNNAPEPVEPQIDANISEARINEMAQQLTEENEEIRNLTLCKMCQTSEVNVLFLPCGHLVACAQCAPALTTCAMCRQPVKGSVRVHLDDSKDSERELDAAAHTDHEPPALV